MQIGPIFNSNASCFYYVILFLSSHKFILTSNLSLKDNVYVLMFNYIVHTSHNKYFFCRLSKYFCQIYFNVALYDYIRCVVCLWCMFTNIWRKDLSYCHINKLCLVAQTVSQYCCFQILRIYNVLRWGLVTLKKSRILNWSYRSDDH